MRYFYFTLLFFSFLAKAQTTDLSGTWQGVFVELNQDFKDGQALWLELKIDKETGEITGESRYETAFTDYFALKTLKGTSLTPKSLSFSETFMGMQKNSSRAIWCLNDAELRYNDTTGYLSGSWRSSDCSRKMGEIILYRSRYEMSKTDTISQYHSWFNNFVADLVRGWDAYYVRDAEMRSFEFVPVYFDHDKDELKKEFESYLQKMADIVVSHTDLRIKIIGHTDSNGPDGYNVNLSERRAENIKKFLIKCGLKADRIVIEYRGEKDPATTNSTSQGKQLNRRVDFEFI